MEIVELEVVDSTNRYARDHFDELADGALVVSAAQTAGRGRRGRVWHSPAGVNVYLSFVMKQTNQAFLAGAAAGLAVLDCLSTLAPEVKAYIKWPNDVYVGDRKLAGMLCEGAGVKNGRLLGVIAGIGVNVNLDAAFLSGIDQPATSLAVEAGMEFDVKKVVQGLAKSLLRYYIIYSKYPDRIFRGWKNANRLLGEEIELAAGTGELLRGVFADIAEDGELILISADGTRRHLNCGDIRIRRESVNWKKVASFNYSREVRNE